MRIYRVAGAVYSAPIVDKLVPSMGSMAWADRRMPLAIKILYDMGKSGITTVADFTAIFDPAGIGAYGPEYTICKNYIDVFYRNKGGRNAEINGVLGPLLTTGGSIVASALAASGVTHGLTYTVAMKQDFNLVLSTFGKSVATTRTEQHPMFLKLFGYFSNQIYNAANGSGKKDLAAAISNQALLRPADLFKVIKLSKAQTGMYDVSNKLIDDIMRSKHDMKFAPENFHIVKEMLMKSFGFISAEQNAEVEKQRKNQNLMGGDPSASAPTSAGGTPKPDHESVAMPFNPSNEQWINPGFITALMIFFNQYNNKLMKLPD